MAVAVRWPGNRSMAVVAAVRKGSLGWLIAMAELELTGLDNRLVE